MKALVRLCIFGILLCSLTGILSCSSEADCSMETRGMMECKLYALDSRTGTVSNDTLDSLTVTAYGTDSVIINRQANVTSLSLPLRYTTDSTVFIFQYTTRRRDTLTVYQTNTPYFLSMDCGYQMKQTINSVTHTRHSLDSIYIANNEANIYGTENLKLFY